MNYIKKLVGKIARQLIHAASITDINTAQKKIAFNDSQKFIYHNSSLNTLAFNGPNAVKDLHSYCIQNLNKEGVLFEFGVFKGTTLNFFARTLKEMRDERVIVGFDSWKGFSEEWSGVNDSFKIDTFDQKGILPKVESNTTLVDGYIEETLPKYISEHKELESVAFIHIDTDTYSPAKVVLSELREYFKPGTIIVFDELLGYPNWRSHEFKALSEVLDPSEYEFIGFAHNGLRAFLIKAAIRIL
jgi:hypothetical protein